MASDVKASSDSRGAVSGRKLMRIDYSQDTRATYRDFAFACIVTEPNDILAAALRRLSPNSPLDWPAWLPGWRLSTTSTHGRNLPTTWSMESVTMGVVNVTVECSWPFIKSGYEDIDNNRTLADFYDNEPRVTPSSSSMRE
ncbi:hypothetical protein T440DRAFT_480230 [Plenodomus tracheiphilus IPT5]|uniref:Uncharacterized protein n=1 Tax=Plenodomus tracheiphilus IPT5 TaxID=1408161 RepID=A0A6A7B276_9PLEO|nr:hypothetical protein T440DRAFT_480230 [Plenodomus tracheiphilus IPT5]